jgi:hypothetical protein
MGTWNVPIQPLLTEIWGGIGIGFWVVFGLGTPDTQLARRKLGKNTYPNHGSHHCHMATMVPFSWHRRIQQLANMLHNKSMLLKLENIIVFTIYLLAILRHDASLTCRA